MEKEFIPGKWYKGQVNTHYIKFSHLESEDGFNKIHYTQKINRRPDGMYQHMIKEDWWANNDFEQYALRNPVSLEELAMLLPKDHPDIQPQGYQIY